MTTRSLRSLLLAAATALLLLTGCDSDDPSSPPEATVQFGTDVLSAVGPSVSPVELPVTLSEATGEMVTVDVLLAIGASEDLVPADLSIDSLDEEASYYDYNEEDDDEDDVLTGYIIDTVEFPASAEAGATRSVLVDLPDNLSTERKVAVFALQNSTSTVSEGRQRVRIGSPGSLTLTLNVITLLEADFDYSDTDGSFPDPLTAFDAGGSANWSSGEFSDVESSPYAQINAYEANEPSNDWLVSPAFDFTEAGAKTLTFRNATSFDDGGVSGEALKLLVSTDYDGEGNPDDADWTDISDRVNYSGGGYEFVSSGPIDLSDDAFRSEETYVAFQYTSSGTGSGSTEAWQIDDIRLNRSRGGE